MAYQGRQVVDAISDLLETDARQEQRELAAQLATDVSGTLRNLGLESHAGEVFDLFRRLDKEFGEKDESRVARFNAFGKVIITWGEVPNHSIPALFESLNTEYITAKKALFHSRSKAAHVAAVMRPLRRKFIDQWSEGLGSYFDLESAIGMLDELNNASISTNEQFNNWATRVYNHFEKIAVIDNEQYKKAHGIKRPLGMIGAGSLRTYRLQWEKWTKAMGRRVLEQLAESKVEPEPPLGGFNQAAYNSYPETSSRLMSMAAPRVEEQAFQSVPTGPSVTVRISTIGDEILTAESTWNSGSLAIASLPTWVEMMSLAWGGSERVVAVELVFNDFAGEKKLSLPQSELASVVEPITRVISNFA